MFRDEKSFEVRNQEKCFIHNFLVLKWLQLRSELNRFDAPYTNDTLMLHSDSNICDASFAHSKKTESLNTLL